MPHDARSFLEGAFGVCKARNDRERQCASVVRSRPTSAGGGCSWGSPSRLNFVRVCAMLVFFSPLYYIITADDFFVYTFKRALSEREALERLEGGEPAGCDSVAGSRGRRR